MTVVRAHPPCISSEASYYRVLSRHAKAEELHCHRELTTIRVLEGVVYLIAEHDERPLTPGDEVVVKPGELHLLFNAGDGDAHVLEGVRPADCELGG